MVLLELTEKEAEILRKALIAERLIWEDDEKNWGNHTNAANNADSCKSGIAKIDAALQPRSEILITDKDLFFIISNAKMMYSGVPSNLYISNKRIEENDFKHIAIANSITMWLNSKNLLKNLVKFDYTDHSCQYEELE